MKRFASTILSLACLFSFIACKQEINVATAPEFTFNLIPTGDITKTEMNSAGDNVIWQGTEQMSTYLNGTSKKATIKSDNSFAATVAKSGEYAISAGTYNVQGFIPYGAYVGITRNVARNAVQVYKLKMSATQNPSTTTFDPSADILIAKLVNVEVSAADVEAGSKDVQFNFGRLNAITKISLNRGSSTSIAATESVKRVEIIFPEDVKVAGNLCFDATMHKCVSTFESENNTAVSDYRNVFCEDATNTLTLSYPIGSRPQVDALDLWAVVPPVTVNAGETITFKIYTDAHTITKTATPSSAITFSNQQLNTLSLNLASATVEDPEPADTYKLVSNASDIVAGEYILASAPNNATSTFYCLPNAPATNENPTLIAIAGKDGVTMSNDKATLSVDTGVSDITWRFVSATGGFNIVPTNDQTIGLGTTASTGSNIRVSSYYVGKVWNFNSSTDYNWQIYSTASSKTMYLAVFSATTWRNYDKSTTNQNGKFYIYKKESLAPAIQVSATSVDATAVSDLYDITATLVNSSSSITPSCDGTVVTDVEYEDGKYYLTVADNKSLNVRSGWVKFSSDGAEDVTVSVDQEAAVFIVSKTAISLGCNAEDEETFTVTADFPGTISYEDNDSFMTYESSFNAGTTTITVTALEDSDEEVVLGTITVLCTGFDASTAKTLTVSQEGPDGVEVAKSISSYADGTYFIVDTFDDKYYALTGAVSNKSIASTDITSAVTVYSDGSISIDETNTVITDEMKYSLEKSSNNYILSYNETEIHLLAKGNNLGSTATINWTGFEQSSSSIYRFSLTATGSNSNGNATQNCLLLQGINYNSNNKVFVTSLIFKGYAQSNRGFVAEDGAKVASYGSGYMYFVPVNE